MTDRAELLESALDALGDGVALAGADGRIAFWNSAAELITGWAPRDVIGRKVRQMIDDLLPGGTRQWARDRQRWLPGKRGSLVCIRHKIGYEIPVLAHFFVLRDRSGAGLGTEVLFHPTDGLDALPQQGPCDAATISPGHEQFHDRLVCMHEECRSGNLPMGVLCVSVDQGRELKQSHGSAACEAMLRSVEKTIASGMKPAEEIGRWGDQEFLILCHERSAAMLAVHAQMLAGLARTSDFRWWGDRISLTVSIGAAQVQLGESLCALLERAQTAMEASFRAGGNRITAAQGSR